jgi:hypothetical protein
MVTGQLTSFILHLEGASGTSQAHYSNGDHWESNDQANEQVNDDSVIPRIRVEKDVGERGQDRAD